jgi:hypothetical protein
MLIISGQSLQFITNTGGNLDILRPISYFICGRTCHIVYILFLLMYSSYVVRVFHNHESTVSFPTEFQHFKIEVISIGIFPIFIAVRLL